MNMQEPFITKGQWWLPETPENKVPGELQYTPDEGIRLELQGDPHIPGDGNFRPPIPKNASLILGISSRGQEVSLLNCQQLKSQVSFAEYIGTVETAFRAGYAFIGIHFQSPESAQFNELTVCFSHLDDWMNHDPFQIDYPSITSENPNFIEFTLHYTRPAIVEANIGQLSISFVTAGPNTERPSAGEYVLSQKVRVAIQSNTRKVSIDDFMLSIRRVQDFLTLGVGGPVYPIDVEGYSESEKQILNGGNKYRSPIKIFYNRPWQPKIQRRIYPFEMVFTLTTLQDRLAKSLSCWFKAAKNLEPVLDIYFSLLYREQIYTEQRFLSIAQAIESYHRLKFGGKYQNDDDFLSDLFPKLVQAIPPGLDPGFKQSLIEGKLRYANEYSLRKRLVELTRHLAEFLPLYFLANTKKRYAFIERVCDTRNYLTHYDPELHIKAATTGREQYELFKKLRAILEALLLEDIGFEPGQISEMIKKNGIYHDLFVEQPS